MTRRIVFALCIAAALAPHLAAACTPDMNLSQVIDKAAKEFDRNPRATIHQCFMPFMYRMDEEESMEVRERFLYLVVTRTTLRPPRPHNLNLIIEAGEAYLTLVPNLTSPQSSRVAKVLGHWGKALLLANRKQGLHTIHRQYVRATLDNPRFLNPELARMWMAVLRCGADSEGCRSQPEFECGMTLQCGTDDLVVEFLRTNPAGKRSWEDFLDRLKNAVQSGQTALTTTRDDVASLLAQAAS